ncbi:MAG: superfamily protein [Verrucomicrobiaceae bacterium]|nr:superfamily protein [Verrucomicrobiaceae bacterium]
MQLTKKHASNLIFVAALFIFISIASAISGDNALTQFDHTVSDALQHALPLDLLKIIAAFTHSGDGSTRTLLTIGVALWLAQRYRYTLMLSWCGAVAGNGALNRLLKLMFQRVRPPHEHGLIVETDWSFPSGHASGAMVAYGMLAFVLTRGVRPVWHAPIYCGATLLILAIGFSRVALQVHYFSDVIAGFAIGAVWLIACIQFYEWLNRKFQLKAARPR